MIGLKKDLRTTDPDFEVTEPLNSEMTTDANKPINAEKIYKSSFYCSTTLNIILIIVIICLSVVKKEISCPICAPCEPFICPDFWIKYGGKYFYVSKEEKNWTMSLKMCSSFNASLAVIDTQKELDFFADILQPVHFWFGLSKEANVWKLPNGIEFKNQFPVQGKGFCAYVNGKGADSTICSMEKRFLCSYPESCNKIG